jgi:hypothetical protein
MKDGRIKQYKNGSKGRNPGQVKKNPGRCKLFFFKTFRPALGHIQPPVQWMSGFVPGGKAAGT